MTENPKVIICDCDHSDVNMEKEVFDQAGLPFKWLQCQTQDEVIAQCKGAEVFLNQYVKMDEKIFSAIPTLKCIVRYGVGVDNVNLADAKKYGVHVCNVPDYGVSEVADQAVTLMLAVVRKVWLAAKKCAAGHWDYADTIPVHRLNTMTVGVVGTGRIGRAFIERAHGLKLNVIAFDPAYCSATKPDERIPYVKYVDSLMELCRQSDIISLHCSLDETNVHMLNEETFAAMKDGVYLINVSRGGLIDEDALDRALESGKVQGAGLDVFHKEPLNPDSPLFRHENCLITPHMSWYSEEAAKELKQKCALEAVRFLNGEALVNEVI